MDKELFEIKTCQLRTVSPIHIGSVEQKLTPFEYIVKDGFIYMVSDEKLSLFLKDHNLIEPFVREVGVEGHRFRIMDFFKKHNIKIETKDLLEISGKRFSKISGNISLLQDFRPSIRDGMGKIYIPGTSIKGVIRTAVLYNILKIMKNTEPLKFKQQIEEKIESDIANRVSKKKMFQWGIEEWLESFVLNGKKRNPNPNTDWLRILHVTDAYPENDFVTYLIPINLLKKVKNGFELKKEKTERLTTIWAECIPEGVTFSFQLLWDKKLLNDFLKQNKDVTLPKSLEELFENINTWINDVALEEKKFLNKHNMHKWYTEGKDLNFRIGFGSGIMATTIFPLLSEELRKKIRNYAGLNRGQDEAPKSRRVWINNNIYVPLGWAQLTSRSYEKGTPIFSSKKHDEEKIRDIEIDEKNNLIENVHKDKKDESYFKKVTDVYTWKNAYLSWFPNTKTIVATFEGKKAEIQIGDNKSFVPEKYHKKLFDQRKGVQANVKVESIGNAFKIVSIEE